MSLDRSIAPDFRPVEKVYFPSPQKITLPNGQPLYVVNVGEQPVVRLEVIFEAGTWHEQIEGASFFATKMLAEGTEKYHSAQISSYFDGLGAFVDFNHSSDRANIIVYGLAKHLEALLAMVVEIIQTATFPEKEWGDLKNITLQNLKINLEKNAYVATTAFKELLFGAQHPYGRSQKAEKMEDLTLQNIKDFYHQRIKSRPFRVFISGKVSDAEIEAIHRYLGQVPVFSEDFVANHVVLASDEKLLRNDKPDAMQTSLRIGRRMIGRKHPDFYALLVANEILGGYFGSRLMQNIREDKGYTYGISSSMAALLRDGFWTISTDVKKEFWEATLDEIQREIEKMQTTLVGEEELEKVKNFMSGEFAGALNTPFEIADRVKVMVLDGLEEDFYSNHISRLRVVKAEEIREIAQKYWQWDDLYKVAIG
ncbi:MAG: M16 family metallopeptidase [Runella sp.]